MMKSNNITSSIKQKEFFVIGKLYRVKVSFGLYRDSFSETEEEKKFFQKGIIECKVGSIILYLGTRKFINEEEKRYYNKSTKKLISGAGLFLTPQGKIISTAAYVITNGAKLLERIETDGSRKAL